MISQGAILGVPHAVPERSRRAPNECSCWNGSGAMVIEGERPGQKGAWRQTEFAVTREWATVSKV